jgi:hypothetical protein
MKPSPFTQLKFAAACAALLIVQACVTVPGSWKNEKISSGKRDDFHQLNSDALRYLKANDPKGLRALLSKEMLGENNERLVELISNRLTDNPYDLLDEYYVVNRYRDTDTVATQGGDIKRYAMIYPYAATQMYFAFFIPKKPASKYMISLIFAKFDYGWKIIKMELAPYTINGKTAPELFDLAEDEYNKKYLQAALNNVTLALSCITPCSYWRYPQQHETAIFYGKLTALVEERYRYPLVLKQVSTGPMILRVYSKTTDDGTFPLIYYMTHFNVSDTNAVKKENLQIRSAVKKIMPGLDEGSPYIYYSAFNKEPTGYETVDHFDMIEKLH